MPSISVCTPTKFRGQLEFWVFGGRSKYFWFKRYIFYGEVSLFSVCFPILECKTWKIQIFLPEAPPFSIFTFSDLRWMQGLKYALTLMLNLIFFVQGVVSFHPSVSTQNQLNPWNCFLFLSILEGFQNHLLSKAILCEYKQTWHLLFKIKGNSFLNKQRVYNMKESFEMESADLLSLTDNPLY